MFGDTARLDDKRNHIHAPVPHGMSGQHSFDLLGAIHAVQKRQDHRPRPDGRADLPDGPFDIIGLRAQQDVIHFANLGGRIGRRFRAGRKISLLRLDDQSPASDIFEGLSARNKIDVHFRVVPVTAGEQTAEKSADAARPYDGYFRFHNQSERFDFPQR